jgi:hypothetical protein
MGRHAGHRLGHEQLIELIEHYGHIGPLVYDALKRRAHSMRGPLKLLGQLTQFLGHFQDLPAAAELLDRLPANRFLIVCEAH